MAHKLRMFKFTKCHKNEFGIGHNFDGSLDLKRAAKGYGSLGNKSDPVSFSMSFMLAVYNNILFFQS